MPTSSRSPGAPTSPRRHELPDDRDHEKDRRDPEHRRLRELPDVGVDADLQEEDRDEQVPDRLQLPPDAIGRVAATEREPGDERADDRRELGRVGELGERERERERERDERARERLLTRRSQAKSRGDEPHADERRHQTRNATATTTIHSTLSAETEPSVDEAHDDGEDDEADHVVGDGGAEHGARLDRRERLEVAEHPRRDADARRGERGADEERRPCGHPDRSCRTPSAAARTAR